MSIIYNTNNISVHKFNVKALISLQVNSLHSLYPLSLYPSLMPNKSLKTEMAAQDIKARH